LQAVVVWNTAIRRWMRVGAFKESLAR
jgi:hypothetical protein